MVIRLSLLSPRIRSDGDGRVKRTGESGHRPAGGSLTAVPDVEARGTALRVQFCRSCRALNSHTVQDANVHLPAVELSPLKTPWESVVVISSELTPEQKLCVFHPMRPCQGRRRRPLFGDVSDGKSCSSQRSSILHDAFPQVVRTPLLVGKAAALKNTAETC